MPAPFQRRLEFGIPLLHFLYEFGKGFSLFALIMFRSGKVFRFPPELQIAFINLAVQQAGVHCFQDGASGLMDMPAILETACRREVGNIQRFCKGTGLADRQAEFPDARSVY